MNHSEFYLEFDSNSLNEGFARMVVSAFTSRLDPTLEEIADIKTAVSEAVTNAILHGYNKKPGMVKLRCTIEDSLLTVEVSDDGAGIEDIEKAREPLYTTRPELERSGMGFSFMETFMDTLEIESKVSEGTKIRMTKNIGGEKRGMS